MHVAVNTLRRALGHVIRLSHNETGAFSIDGMEQTQMFPGLKRKWTIERAEKYRRLMFDEVNTAWSTVKSFVPADNNVHALYGKWMQRAESILQKHDEDDDAQPGASGASLPAASAEIAFSEKAVARQTYLAEVLGYGETEGLASAALPNDASSQVKRDPERSYIRKHANVLRHYIGHLFHRVSAVVNAMGSTADPGAQTRDECQ